MRVLLHGRAEASKVDQGRLNLVLGPGTMGKQVEVLAYRPEDLSLIATGRRVNRVPQVADLHVCARHLDLSIIGVGETLGARISFTPQ